MFLGLDIGTSSVKAALMDTQLRPCAEASVPLTTHHPHPGWSEQDPVDWWHAACLATRNVCQQTPGPVTAIGLSGQMHGAILLDKDHTVIRPAILWNDNRAETECDDLIRDRPELAHIAGVRPMPGLTAPKILWLARHAPQDHARIAHILLPKDYLGWKLHGNLVTDRSDAAGTWWLDQAAGSWSPGLSAATQTDPSWLPDIRSGADLAGSLLPQAAQALGLTPGLPVCVGAGDTVAGAVALGALRDGDSFVSLGTSGQLFTVAGSFDCAPWQGVHSFAHTLPELWYHMAAMLNGARPMAWCAEMTGTPIETLLAEAAMVDTGHLPLALPYLTGERTPHGDAKIRGALYGLENNTSRGQIMRAVIDAIAYSFADAKATLDPVHTLPQELRVVGGGARADLLLQTLADVLGITLLRTEDAAIGPALGASRLAALSVGACTLDDLVHDPVITARFGPSANATRHGPRLESYRALYAALKPMRDAPR